MERQKARSQQRNEFGIALVGRLAHSIGNFFLCYIVLFPFETSFPGSPGNYLYMFDYFFCIIIIYLLILFILINCIYINLIILIFF